LPRAVVARKLSATRRALAIQAGSFKAKDHALFRELDMTIEKNKETAIRFIKASGAHDAATVEALLSEDVVYWVQGKPHLFPYAGVKTKQEMCAYFATPSIFENGLEQRIGAVTAEDDRVAVEVEVEGVAPNGRLYNNTFHYLLRFRDGQICEVKEYLDTYHAAEVFLQGPAKMQ
jgi:ketosteroid isomerase-like protein